MFGRRKKDSSSMHSVCPYCGNSNEIGAKECNLCYYDLTASAREQPMATPSTAESDIMTTLLDDHATVDESEDYAVEAILSIDDVTVEIDQFETQGAGEDDEFAFISSSGPTLSEVQNYTKPEEVELSPEDAPKSHADFELPDSNPLDEVAEPVHTGQGSVFFNADNSDDDFTGSVGPSNQANMESAAIIHEIAEAKSNNIQTKPSSYRPDTPKLPDIFRRSTQLKEGKTERLETTPELPEDSEEPPLDDTPEIPDIPSETVIEPPISSADNAIVTPAPKPQTNGRIWPWPAKQPLDERIVYREVVAMLELIKTGKLTQTAQQLDRLGPHLDANLDMLAHIGTIMRYLGREEHLQWMLSMAKATYPNDADVARALNHLS
ncbi:MAG: hypothetical protein VXY53_03045 [Candidatus Thermoplasmatota archaeon]|nr:hypothetical protein [Candidatus Thermoplasmatota archaeon]